MAPQVVVARWRCRSSDVTVQSSCQDLLQLGSEGMGFDLFNCLSGLTTLRFFFYISKSLELSKDLGLKIMAIAFMYWYLVFIHSLVLQGNDAGDYFPIWGTCQGFQQLTVLTANKNLLTLTDTKAVALPLTLTSGFSVTFCYSIWLFCQVRYKLAYILSESFKLAYFYIFIP